MQKENIFNFKSVDTQTIKDLATKADPYIFAIYIEYYENCLRVVFNNGLDIDLPYPPGMDYEKAFPINDIYYRRN